MAGSIGRETPDIVHPGTGPWTVQFVGIPTHFTWQDLKDEIREEASHVGHVEVLPNRTARIALRVWDEAWKCFKFLASHGLGGADLYVELWETTPTQEPPRRICTNAGRKSAPVSSRGRLCVPPANQPTPPITPLISAMQVQQSYSPQTVRQALPAEYALPCRPCPVPQPSVQQSAYGPTPTFMSTPAPTTSQTRYTERPGSHYMINGALVNGRAPKYAENPGIPTNITRGAVRTEYRGVFISNLSYMVQDNDLHDLFKPYGEIKKIAHNREEVVKAKGKVVSRSKGTAIITFTSSQAAAKAISCLNGRSWNDRVLTLRFDMEGTPVNVPSAPPRPSSSARKSKRSGNDGTPLIVDGSKYGKESEEG